MEALQVSGEKGGREEGKEQVADLMVTLRRRRSVRSVYVYLALGF
jgi:hypothetical protein